MTPECARSAPPLQWLSTVPTDPGAASPILCRSRIESHEVSDIGEPGERWDGAPPATLERVLLHLLQEYARHVGHLDAVPELVDGTVGE